MQRVSFEQLLAATGGRAARGECRDADFARIAIDSRTIRADELFWALRGERYDGHDFVQEALQRGARACVVHEPITRHADEPLIFVPDTLKSFGDFAHWYRQQQETAIIGVTGSVGKTTTREMIHAVLSAAFTGMRSPKNFNNHVGLPLSLLELEPWHQFAILEMGASHRGEIRDLAAIAAPEMGVITGIGPAHLEGFGTTEDIIQAKGELVEALPCHGLAVLAGDDGRVRDIALRAACRVIFVGRQPHNDLRPAHVRFENQRIQFELDRQNYELNATGAHHLTAALTAIAIGREFGMSGQQMAEGLRLFRPAPGRCQVERIGHWTVINDSYNASPNSMQAACRLLRDWTGGNKKVFVIGDMLELGSRSDEFHYDLGLAAADAGIDQLLVYGCQAEHVVQGALDAGMEAHRLAQCSQWEAMWDVLNRWLEPEDVLLVKGSRNMRMERVIEWLRQQANRSLQVNTAGAATPAGN